VHNPLATDDEPAITFGRALFGPPDWLARVRIGSSTNVR